MTTSSQPTSLRAALKARGGYQRVQAPSPPTEESVPRRSQDAAPSGQTLPVSSKPRGLPLQGLSNLSKSASLWSLGGFGDANKAPQTSRRHTPGPEFPDSDAQDSQASGLSRLGWMDLTPYAPKAMLDAIERLSKDAEAAPARKPSGSSSGLGSALRNRGGAQRMPTTPLGIPGEFVAAHEQEEKHPDELAAEYGLLHEGERKDMLSEERIDEEDVNDLASDDASVDPPAASVNGDDHQMGQVDAGQADADAQCLEGVGVAGTEMAGQCLGGSTEGAFVLDRGSEENCQNGDTHSHDRNEEAVQQTPTASFTESKAGSCKVTPPPSPRERSNSKPNCPEWAPSSRQAEAMPTLRPVTGRPSRKSLPPEFFPAPKPLPERQQDESGTDSTAAGTRGPAAAKHQSFRDMREFWSKSSVGFAKQRVDGSKNSLSRTEAQAALQRLLATGGASSHNLDEVRRLRIQLDNMPAER